MKTCLDDPEYQTWQNNEITCSLYIFFQLRRVTVPYRGKFLISPGKVMESLPARLVFS